MMQDSDFFMFNIEYYMRSLVSRISLLSQIDFNIKKEHMEQCYHKYWI